MGMSGKRTNEIESAHLSRLLAVARGDTPADIVLKNIQILNLVTGERYPSEVAIYQKWIAGVGEQYSGKLELDGKNRTIVPGFIDSHLHIESSMMHPFEFEKLTLPLGTTTAICDPHEITNVMGPEGFEWFLRCAEKMRQNLFVQVSSCIPSLPGFETVGGDFPVEVMKKYREHENVLGLAEMMNFPGVVNGDPDVLAKIAAFSDMNLDGHCPLVRGKVLNAYLCAGIQNCHETITREEGKEKLEKGMGLIIREGSVAKNLLELAPLANDFSSPQCMLCTDDRNPYEIFHEGHINYLVKTLIQDKGMEPYLAYRLSSWSAAKHFGLKRLGLIAPGYVADFILLDDVQQVQIAEVWSGGKKVESNFGEDTETQLKNSNPPLKNTINRKTIERLDFNLTPGSYNVIGIVEEELVTTKESAVFDGKKFDHADVLKIAVIERYGQESAPALGLVKGMGLKSGAMASTVAHDCHNIIVIGVTEEDMVFAVNQLIESGGGQVVVENEQVLSKLDLPVGGLISLESAEGISEQIRLLKNSYQALGVKLGEPFIQMAFLALPVIPSLKITDKGLVDVDQFSFIPLKK